MIVFILLRPLTKSFPRLYCKLRRFTRVRLADANDAGLGHTQSDLWHNNHVQTSQMLPCWVCPCLSESLFQDFCLDKTLRRFDLLGVSQSLVARHAPGVHQKPRFLPHDQWLWCFTMRERCAAMVHVVFSLLLCWRCRCLRDTRPWWRCWGRVHVENFHVNVIRLWDPHWLDAVPWRGLLLLARSNMKMRRAFWLWCVTLAGRRTSHSSHTCTIWTRKPQKELRVVLATSPSMSFAVPGKRCGADPRELPSAWCRPHQSNFFWQVRRKYSSEGC